MKLLRTSLPMLRSRLPRLQQSAEAGPLTARLTGKGLQLMRKRCIVRDGYACQCPWCQAGGHPLRLTMPTMELDHTIPLHLGGTNAMDNLRCLHVDCHRRITDEQRAGGWLRDAGGPPASGGDVSKKAAGG